MIYTAEQISISIEHWEEQIKQYRTTQQHWFNISSLKKHLESAGIPEKNLLNDVILKVFSSHDKYTNFEQIIENTEYQTQIILQVESFIYAAIFKLINSFKQVLDQLKDNPNNKIFIFKSILDIVTAIYNQLFLNDYMVKITTLEGLLNGVLYKLLYQSTTNSTTSFIQRLTSAEMNLRLKIISSQNNKMVFIGKNGSGKSQFSRALLNPNNHDNITIIPAIKDISLRGIQQSYSFTLSENNYLNISSNPKLVPTVYQNASHLVNAITYLRERSTDFYKENISHDIQDPIRKVEFIFNKILEDKKALNLYNRDNHPKVTDMATGDKYDIANMSDGEKTILYLISCIVLSKKKSIIIADEPEVHLHKSIQNKLWDELEAYIDEQESIIIYITHDIDFMKSRSNASFYLFKSYNPKTQKLDLKPIENTSKIPDELFFELTPLTKPIIFCEGSTQRDKNLYEVIFQDVTIVECGSCDDVISRTKALNNDNSIRSKVYGLVDKDDRSEKEIENLKQNHIYTIPVACVENLYLNIEFIKALIDTPVMISEKVHTKLEHKITGMNDNQKQEIYLQDYLEDALNSFNKTHTATNYINYYIQNYTQKMDFTDTKYSWIDKIQNKKQCFQAIYDKNVSIINNLDRLKDKYNKYLEIYRHHNLSIISTFCGIIPNKKDNEFEGKLIRLLKTDKNFKVPLNKVRIQLKNHVNCTEFNRLIDK